MTVSLSRPALQPQVSIVGKFGFYALMLWLFVYISRILDTTVPHLKIPMILNIVWLAAALLDGGIRTLMTSRVATIFSVFFLWVCLCVPFSVWRGGSVETTMTTLRSLLLMIAILTLVRSVADCRKLMYTIGFAVFTAAIVSAATGEFGTTGRLALSAGAFSDPNYYCIVLVSGMPFLLLVTTLESSMWKKIAAFGAVVALLMAAVRTGSRSGFVALIAMLVVYFLRSSPMRRLYLVVATVLITLIITAFASDYIIRRYTTIFSAEYDESLTVEEYQYLAGSTVGSTEARRHLLRRSIELTFANPLVGVGPGMFAVAEAEDAKERGIRASWHETHNTFTQVSSETGVPGFLLYAIGIVVAFGGLMKLARRQPQMTPEGERDRQVSIHLQMSLISALMGAMFLSMAYNGLLFILFALAGALVANAKRELAPAGAVSHVERRTLANLVPAVPRLRPIPAPVTATRRTLRRQR